MRFEHLDEFAALALTLNYSKVAKRFHTSPSVLSKHITALEREVGQQLFTRSTTSVELTAAGRRFYEGMSPIIEDYHAFMDDFCNGRTSRSHLLNVAVGVRTAQTLRMVALAAHRLEADNGIKVNFANRETGTLYKDPILSETDAIITYANEKLTRESIIIPLKRDPFVAVIPREHPLASKSSISIVNDMARYRTIRLKDTYFEPGQEAIRAAFERFNVRPDYVYSLASSFDDISLFFNLKEVLILPSEATSLLQVITPETHVILPFEEDVYFQLSLVYPPKNESEALRLFTTKLKEIIAETEATEDL